MREALHARPGPGCALSQAEPVRVTARPATARASPLLLVRLALYVLLVITLVKTTADPDLWGHVLFGRDIVAQGTVPRVDPYSFTSDREWINHEWLAEVLTYAAYRFGGSSGLVALKLAVLLVALAIISRVVRRAGAAPLVCDVLLLVAVVGSLARLPFVRPQIFSLLMFTAELAVMVAVDRGARKSLMWLPPVFALWANLHGGFIVGLGVLAVWAAWSAFAGPAGWGARLSATGALVAAVMATAVNPYGFGLWKFIWETVQFGRPTITDWLPLYRSPVLLAFWAVPAATAVLVLVRAGRPERWSYLAIVGLLALASLRVSRLDAFFCLSVVLLLAPRLGRLWPRQTGATSRAQPLSIKTLCVTAAAAAGILVPAGIYAGGDAGCIGVDAPLFPEPEAVRFILANHLRGKMFTFFDYGEYAIWYLAPAIRVSMDGRRETVYGDEVISSHWGAYHNKGEASKYTEALQADYAWVPLKTAAVEDLEQHGWIPVFQGKRSVVLARSRPAALVEPPSVPLRRCFPGP